MQIIHLKDQPAHNDERGEIQMILESCEIGSISRIASNVDSSRARHYHPADYHWCEVIEGCVEYYEQFYNGRFDEPVLLKTLHKGDIFFTPPMNSHEMIFPCYTVLNCYSHLPRVQSNYEKETIRFSHSLRDLYYKK
jgi:hypothetical protein